MGRHQQQARHDPDGRRKRALEELRSTMTEEELERAKQIREFNDLQPNTLSYSIALFNDQLRQNRIVEETKVVQRLLTMKNLYNHAERMKEQFTSRIVTEQLTDGVTMNLHELEVVAQREQWLMKGEAVAIIRCLAELRSIVGHKDIATNIVLTQEEFDNYASKTIEEIKTLGFDLFTEYNL